MKKQLLKVSVCIMALLGISCCTEQGTMTDTLTVKPNEALSFKASGNRTVTLSVNTTAEDWDFTAPDWVIAQKGKNLLEVNVQDNENEKARVGRITFTAGAAKDLSINVRQEGLSAEDPEDPGQPENPGQPEDPLLVKINLVNKTEDGKTSFIYSKESIKATVSLSLSKPAEEDIVATVSLDNPYVYEYSYINNKTYLATPEGSVQFSETTLTIPAGQTTSRDVEITINGEQLEHSKPYLLPVYAKVTSGAASFDKDANRINFVVTRGSNRTTRQVVYLEVNNTNPLNILEYNLEDGTPFFDAVVLFAANIRWDSSKKIVYLHNNPNVQALLDNTETYIQPLREKGIKVYLGLLGDHTIAGLAQLTDYGCVEFAKEVAEACRVYKLDGVNLDDEYSNAPPSQGNQWILNSKSGFAAARLCYELKKSMREECDWPTDVSYFKYGGIQSLPTITVDGVEHQPSEFVDWFCCNYGVTAEPYGDLTYANCASGSKELNLGKGDVNAALAKEKGYGWCMWFAFHPQDGGGLTNNRNRAMGYFNSAAEILYGQRLAQPQYQYKKNGEGQYDPNPHKL